MLRLLRHLRYPVAVIGLSGASVAVGGAFIVSFVQLLIALVRVHFPVAACPPLVMVAWAVAGHLRDLGLWKALDKPLSGVRSHPSRDLLPMIPLGPVLLHSTSCCIMVMLVMHTKVPSLNMHKRAAGFHD